MDRLLSDPQTEGLLERFGRPLTVEALRSALAWAREEHQEGRPVPDGEQLIGQAAQSLLAWTTPSLQPLINATGVIIHTNLGRAPLSEATRRAMGDAARGYTNLEYDLESGGRGTRYRHAEEMLLQLLEAEAALVVNNNAAAVLLALAALASRRRVVIARSQLVEIGGGFRVPEIMQQSTARLLEVGATNRVHLEDYEAALEGKVALVMRAHRSNFRIVGFASEPSLPEITALAHRFDVPVLDDLGSGALIDTGRYGLGHEPMVQESLAAGADLVCFSGDKLLGGPQAGILVGRADLVARLKEHPLARAVRADKICLAGIAATLAHYLKDEVIEQVPVWRMISASLEELEERAQAWAARLGRGEVISGQSTVGGGSLPGETLPSALLALPDPSPNRLLARLRRTEPPIIARVLEDQVVLDPRTVLLEEEPALLAGLTGD